MRYSTRALNLTCQSEPLLNSLPCLATLYRGVLFTKEDLRKHIAQNVRPGKGTVQPQGTPDLAHCSSNETPRLRSPQFTAKQLNRQAAKAGKDEQTEKGKLKKVHRILCPIPPTWPSAPADTTKGYPARP